MLNLAYGEYCIESAQKHASSSIVPSRRLEDRIRRLCLQALEVDGTNSAEVLSKLRAALREHVAQVRKMAVRHLAGRGEARLRRMDDK